MSNPQTSSRVIWYPVSLGLGDERDDPLQTQQVAANSRQTFAGIADLHQGAVEGSVGSRQMTLPRPGLHKDRSRHRIEVCSDAFEQICIQIHHLIDKRG